MSAAQPSGAVSAPSRSSPALGSTVYASPEALSRVGAPVLKLPTSALRQEGGGTAVWVLDKATMTVRSQPVQVTTSIGLACQLPTDRSLRDLLDRADQALYQAKNNGRNQVGLMEQPVPPAPAG